MKIILALIVGCLCLAKARYNQLTVCPDDYSPLDDCVTLQQLLSDGSIKSNTIIQFVPATFEIKSNTIIHFENVSNVTLHSPSPSERADFVCSGENSGFLLRNTLNVSIRNLNFFQCGVAVDFVAIGEDVYPFVASIAVMDSANIVLDSISFRHGKGGVFAANLYGNFTISNSVFAHMQSTSFILRHFRGSIDRSPTYGTPMVSLSNSEFSGNWCFDKSVDSDACEISVALHQHHYGVTVHVVEVSAFNNTRSGCASGINIESTSSHANQIVFKRYKRHNNSVHGTGCHKKASDFVYFHDGNENTSVDFIDSQLVGNSYKAMLESVVDRLNVNFDDPVRVLYFEIETSSKISISNSIIANNTGNYRSALYYQSGKEFRINRLIISDSVFSNNAIYSSNYYEKGAVVLRSSADALISNCDFVNNTGTGLLLFDMTVAFRGTNRFIENRAYNGGGMAVYGISLILLEATKLVFVDNLAGNFGGGLYVDEDQGVDKIDSCFMEDIVPTNFLQFSNNSAVVAGSDIYGGNLFVCNTTESKPGWQLLTEVVQSLDGYSVDVTSDPLRVCDCSSDQSHDCINIAPVISAVETYPGRQFNLSLMAVGTLLNTSFLTGVPSTVYASILPRMSDTMDSKVIPPTMLVQQTERKCSNLTYQINSRNKDEVLVLAVSASDVSITQELFVLLWQEYSSWHDHVRNVLKHNLVVPAYIEVQLLPCPVGFEMSPESTCVCSSDLKEAVTGCSIDTLLIQKKSSYWVSIKSTDHDNSSTYLTHRHCPFDYCREGTFDFFLEETDDQCNHNRSGVLCGACKPGYSLVLGSTECRKCSNIYLLLLLPFALVGVLLIVFLSLTDMTVASGTINGLLFYANIVSDNRAAFFPPQAAEGFLSVFIAWLNLDFGINSCFYDGMDAYAFTWLQLSFPIYIWLLAFSIIMACRHLAFMNKLCGTNIVQVLATLFLLSYTKLQNTIATSVSFTLVHSSDENDMIVWLKDGNILYLQGKHIALFLVNLLFLILFAAFTLSVVFGPCMQRKTEYRVFCWVSKLKPFYDAYFGPLKDQHRHWTGVLLLSRLVLFLVSTVDVIGVNLISINIVCFLLAILLWQSGSVYKSLALSILDSFFVLNLAILALITLYNKYGGNQYVTIIVSTGSSFAAFCFLLFFHLFKKLKEFLALKRSQRQLLIHDNDHFMDRDNSDQEMLNVVDAGR